jgi:hypothetical protein
MAKVKFNGWQRLWILVSALWLAVVILGTHVFFPTKVPRNKVISSLSRESQSKMVLPQELAEVSSRIKAVPQRDLPEDLRTPGLEQLPFRFTPTYELELPDGSLVEFDSELLPTKRRRW